MAESAVGIVTLSSKHSVAESLDRLEAMLVEKGITVFARVDHARAAEGVGLEMRPTEVLIFGNPKGGTPLMVAAPLSAIDLPFKALAWEDADGGVWVSYNDPGYLAQRFGVDQSLVGALNGLVGFIEKAVA